MPTAPSPTFYPWAFLQGLPISHDPVSSGVLQSPDMPPWRAENHRYQVSGKILAKASTSMGTAPSCLGFQFWASLPFWNLAILKSMQWYQKKLDLGCILQWRPAVLQSFKGFVQLPINFSHTIDLLLMEWRWWQFEDWGISSSVAYMAMENRYRMSTQASRAIWLSSFPRTQEAQRTVPCLGRET